MPKRTLVQQGALTDPPDVLREAFLRLVGRRDVARLLQVEAKDLHYWFYRRGATYRQFQITKRSGGVRTISAPNGGVKLVQQRLVQVLSAVYRPRAIVHGFTSGRSIVTNAAPHVQQRWLLNIDLEQFFDTIHFGRVRGLFLRYGLGQDAADLVARICCHEGKLPQGAPTSPVVTNMICRSLDRTLQAFARSHRCRLSRYADDISISTTQPALPSAIAVVTHDNGAQLVAIGESLRLIIEGHGFRINESKIRLRSQGRSQEVTGLIVNSKINVPRRYVRSVRGMIYAAEHFGVEQAARTFHAKYGRDRRPGSGNADFQKALRGKLEFIRMVKGEKNPTFTGLWNRVCLFNPRLTPKIGTFLDVELAIWVIEFETETAPGRIEQFHGTGFGLREQGIVTAAHCVGGRMRMYQLSKPAQIHRPVIRSLCNDRDLAILQFPQNVKSASVELGDSSNVRVGDDVRSAGFPNSPAAVTRQEGKVIRIGPRFGFVNIFPGFATQKGASGAPLLDSSLRVIGIVLYGPDRRPGQDEQGPPSSAIAANELVNVPIYNGPQPEQL